MITLRLGVGLDAPTPRLRRSVHQVVGRLQGTTGATAEGEEESEDCIVAEKSGNWSAPGPGGAKAARVDVIFRRAP